MTGSSDNDAVTPAKSFGCLMMILLFLAVLVVMLAVLWNAGWGTAGGAPLGTR